MKRFTILVAVLALAVMSFAVVQAQGRPGDVATHIIVFNNGARPNVPAFAQANGLTVTNEYSVINGFAAVVPAGRLAALSRNPNVAYVEPNLEITIAAQSIPSGIDRIYATGNTNLDIDGVDDFRVDVDVAILDTGIDYQHPDLNVVGGIDCTQTIGRGRNRTVGCANGTSGDDDHYHGTHVAGTVAALDNGIGVVGVAPGARLWAVKVLNSQGSGYTSGIIDGIDWVVQRGDIEVINMSLGGPGVSTAYASAIDSAVASGVVVVVAAGNDADDANNYSPAYVPSAITVSALSDGDGTPGGNGTISCRTDEDDTLANFSNYGTAVDIIAPGVCILSTYPLERGEYASISGTSMAAPHVAGAAALLASGANSPANGADVQAIRDQLVNSGNLNWDNSDDGDNIKERLLDVTGFNPTMVATGGGVDPTPEPTPEPTPAPCNHPNPKKCR